jgi:hypothetical protein
VAAGYFGTHHVGDTLERIAAACGLQVQTRLIATTSRDDEGEIEFRLTFAAPRLVDVQLAQFYGSRPQIIALTPLETASRLYLASRLPRPSYEKVRVRTPELQRVWKTDGSSALDFLAGAQDQPRLDENSFAFKYCYTDDCDAIITSHREFDSAGNAYHDSQQPPGCVAANDQNLGTALLKLLPAIFKRPVKLREMVLFFGLSQTVKSAAFMPSTVAGGGVGFDDFTAEIIRKAVPQSNGINHGLNSSSEVTAVWVYEYECVGGTASLRSDPNPLTTLGVVGHLQGWHLAN